MKSQPAKRFQDLIVWQKAHQFVLLVYSYTAAFPKTEIYGLTSQFRRAAVSIPANIAEGFKKRTKPDKAKFFNIAQGSSEECRYYLKHLSMKLKLSVFCCHSRAGGNPCARKQARSGR